MKWLAVGILVALIAALLRGYLKSDDTDASDTNYRSPGDNGGGDTST